MVADKATNMQIKSKIHSFFGNRFLSLAFCSALISGGFTTTPVFSQSGQDQQQDSNFQGGFVPGGRNGGPNFSGTTGSSIVPGQNGNGSSATYAGAYGGGNSAVQTNAQTGQDDFPERLQRIDAMVNKRMAELNVPTYCLAVIRNGRTVFQKPYGYASLQTKQPCTNDTVFGLASLTKTFTALTLLSLVDQNLVALDDPLSKYVSGLTKPYQGLTIRQLASMSAGVPKQVSQEVAWVDQMDILDHTPLVSQPGSQFLYSNFSYRLIGQVIQNVTRRPYLEVVREIIFGPLQMNSSATTVMMQPTGRVAQAYGDNMGNGPLREIEYKNPAISFSAGMLASTSNDLVNYVYGLMSRKMISAQAFKTLWYDRPPLSTGDACPWAFGWHSGPNKSMNNQFVVNMNGGTPGVASTIIILPEANSAVIALCNLRKPPVYAIAKAAAAIAFGNGEEPTSEPTPGAGGED